MTLFKIAVIPCCTLLFTVACANQPSPPVLSPHANTGDITLSQKVFDTDLVITAGKNFAGAISSIRFRGKEFIDAADNGREFQSAVSFDDMGECFNPTEAGSRDDKGQKSSSVLKEASTHDNVLETTTQMAFWFPPNSPYSKPKATKQQGKDYCGTRPDLLSSQNNTVLSQHILHKRVSIGRAGLPNVIDYQVQFHVPEAHQNATFVALSAHLPNAFNRFDFVDLSSGQLILSTGSGPQSLPVIASTADGNYALGIYSPMMPHQNYSYGRFMFPSISKLNCVFRERSIHLGNYDYHCMAVIGNREEVRQTIFALSKQ